MFVRVFGLGVCLLLFNFYRFPVRLQIMLLVMAMFLPVLAALFFHLSVERQETRDVFYERVRNLAYNTALNLDMMLHGQADPVQDAPGKITDLAGLSLDLLQLGERLLGALPAGAQVVVIDKNGKVVLRSRDTEFLEGQFCPPEITQQMMGRAHGEFSILGADGVQRLFSFVQVKRADWRVVAGVP